MSTIFVLSESATTSGLDISEIALLIFGAVLVIGLVGEYAESGKWKRWQKLFALLVIGGVAGELLADGGVFVFSRRLQTTAEAEIAELNKKAADSVKDAENARRDAANALERAAKAEEHLGDTRERAAQAEKEAAKSNEAAEKERLARLQLEARLAPRSLSSSQQRDVVERLKSFRGASLDIFVYGDTSEMLSIGSTISSLARAAGWGVRIWGVSVEMVVVGFVVGTRPGADKATERAADELVLALNHNGISAIRGNVFALPLPGRLTGPPWNGNETAPIRMLIGTKP